MLLPVGAASSSFLMMAVRNTKGTFPKRIYGVVLRKGKILSSQARLFVSLLLGTNGQNAKLVPTYAISR
jgi:hypothetical protein